MGQEFGGLTERITSIGIKQKSNLAQITKRPIILRALVKAITLFISPM